MLNQKSCWEAAGQREGGVGVGSLPVGRGAHLQCSSASPDTATDAGVLSLTPYLFHILLLLLETFSKLVVFRRRGEISSYSFFELFFMGFVQQLATAVGTFFIAYKG